MPKVSHGCETKKAHTDPRPTKSGWDSADAKLAERSLKGKGDGAGQGIVRFWEGWCGGVACFCGDCGKVWRQDGGADEPSVTGNFKESVETAMKGTICF